MTLADVSRLHAHWKTNPPLRVLVRGVGAALGIDWSKIKAEEPAERQKKYMTADDARRLYEATGGRIPGQGV